MAKRYGVAVIGAGDRGRVYSNVWKNVDGIELVSICDIIEERAENVYHQFSYKARYSDYKSAIDRDDVDIVTICTPAYFHSEIGIFAMERGKHVLCEKPMDLSLEKAEKMIKTSEETERVLAFGFQYHNIAGFRKIKKAIDKDIIGRPVIIKFADIRQIRPKLAMHDAMYGNGGPIVDMCSHYFDLMRWYFNSEPVRVMASGFIFSKGRNELSTIQYKALDTASIIIEFSSGDIGMITVTWGLPPKVDGKPEAGMIGPLGLLETDNPFGNNEVICKLEGGVTKEIQLSQEDLEECVWPEKTLVKRFLSAIDGKGVPQRGRKDGYIALASSLATIKSIIQKRPVTLEEIYREKPSVMDCMKG
ncbi:MAG: Gfo/Idh/MocA family protein [bacterium]